MIQVENLTKDYGSRRAVDNISFHAKKGEVIGFLGPNGAGKTTTMRILAGFMPPTEGEVKIAGFDVVDDSLEVRRRVGYMPETVPLYTDMTVFDYLKYMGDLRDVEDVEDRIFNLLEIVQLEDRVDSYIEKLSKGMRQRVGLAQAMIHDPDVLILDEPTIGLDPGQIREVRSVIQNVGKKHTVLLSTHILPEAQQICDRVLIIDNGKIVAEDTTKKLEASLTGGEQQVVLTVSGKASDMVKVLKKVKGVKKVKSFRGGKLEVTINSKEDIRPALVRAVVKAKVDLLEIKAGGLSLEEIFLRLTGGE